MVAAMKKIHARFAVGEAVACVFRSAAWEKRGESIRPWVGEVIEVPLPRKSVIVAISRAEPAGAAAILRPDAAPPPPETPVLRSVVESQHAP